MKLGQVTEQYFIHVRERAFLRRWTGRDVTLFPDVRLGPLSLISTPKKRPLNMALLQNEEYTLTSLLRREDG